MVVDGMEVLQMRSEMIKKKQELLTSTIEKNLKKRAFLKGLKASVEAVRRSKQNMKRAEAFRAKKLALMKKKIIRYFKMVALFERRWLKQVRFELYFKRQLQIIFNSLKTHIIYQRLESNTQSRLMSNAFNSLRQTARDNSSVHRSLRDKIDQRMIRVVFHALRGNLDISRRNKIMEKRAVNLRKRRLVRAAWSAMNEVRRWGEELRNDKILQKIYNQNNQEEFFQVQIRKANKTVRHGEVAQGFASMAAHLTKEGRDEALHADRPFDNFQQLQSSNMTRVRLMF